ncbi:MAG: translation initiation factor IF-3, partial [Chloroflexaceae bacterium]|nr:translation initiation factor IF-3 [Chloroflexaceae bacterium]
MNNKQQQRSDTIRDRYRINNRIRAREVRLIDEQGTQVGIVAIQEAQRMAEERGVDLVEVAPNANPPVCRLMDYGKFRYEQSKKEREARKNQKQTDLKEVRLKPRTSEHDLSVKAKQARRFLSSGDKVKFTVRFKGREMAHTDIGREMLDMVMDQLRDISIVEQKPTLESRALSLVLAPNARVLKAAQQAVRDQNRRIREEKQRRAAGADNGQVGDEAAPDDEDEALEPEDEDVDAVTALDDDDDLD